VQTSNAPAEIIMQLGNQVLSHVYIIESREEVAVHA
jgi:hypothetical protein